MDRDNVTLILFACMWCSVCTAPIYIANGVGILFRCPFVSKGLFQMPVFSEWWNKFSRFLYNTKSNADFGELIGDMNKEP